MCHLNTYCTRHKCSFAHEPADGCAPGVITDVTRPCVKEAECEDVYCTASHPSPVLKAREGLSVRQCRRRRERANLLRRLGRGGEARDSGG